MQMLLAMAAVLITWAVLTVAFVGLGRAIWRVIGPAEQADSFEWVVAFWLGYAATLCFLQVWNFWLPVNGYALLAVCTAGVIAALLNGRALVQFVTTRRRGTVLLLVLIALWVADRALGPGNADDSGNYHYTVIRWANEFPAVPGLANLSAVYTYNNASLLYAAMLNTGPSTGRGEHVTNGLLVIALFAQVVPAIGRLLRPNATPPRLIDLFDVVLLTPAVMLTLGKDLPSPKTDLPPGILTLVMARIALAFLLDAGRQDSARRSRWIIVLAIFAAALVALKLSAGLVALLLLAIPAGYWLLFERPGGKLAARAIGGAILAGLLLVGPWVGRNVILNGYPLYPSKVLALPVEWRVQGQIVDLVRANVGKQSKAGMLFWLHDTLERNHLPRYAKLVNPPFNKDENPPGWTWVRPWFFSLPVSSLIEIVLPAGICLLALLVGVGGRAADPARRRIVALALAPIAGLLFWFVTAPDPRFGWAPAWSLAGILVAWAFAKRSLAQSRRSVVLAAVASLLLTVPTLGFRLAVLSIQKQVQPLRQVPIQFPGPDHGFWPHPTIPFQTIVNRWGVKLYLPVDEQNAMTWGGPLPCCGWNWPPNNPDLRMRNPGDLSAGFVTDPRPSR